MAEQRKETPVSQASNPSERLTKGRKQKIGTVLTAKTAQTAIVRVERLEREPSYGKVVRRRKDFMIHDPKSECRPGDTVMIEETRPLTSQKHWKLIKVVERAPVLGTVDATLATKPPVAGSAKTNKATKAPRSGKS